MRQKYRICESDSAVKFCEVTLFLQDDVYARTCDLQDSSKLFGADLYFHRVRLPDYFNKYNRVTNKNNNKIAKTTKRDTFNLYAHFLKSVFHTGTVISLSEIRDMINDEHKINIANSAVKTFLTEHFHFQNQIQFCPSVAEKPRKDYLIILI